MSDEVLRDKGGLLSPVIRRIDYRGLPAILKDYRGKNALTRSVLGPSLVRREYRILKALEGVRGIPRAYAILEGGALVTEFVEGRTLSKFRAGDLPDDVFGRLRDVVRAMHARGVAHLDLRQKKNILIPPDHHPVLVDFGAAVLAAPRTALRRLFPLLRNVDESALLKVKQRTFPDLLTEEDREALRRHRFWRRFWIFSPRGKYAR